ncbi:MAG: copper resistance protein B [Hyphomonadaceae bacterium]|nr:copper resistance protein B [Hyphomonadaceae bacterium]
MTMPQATTPDPSAGHETPGMTTPPASSPDPHAGHDMPGMQMNWPGSVPESAAMPNIETSADNDGRPPEAPAPTAASEGPAHAADLFFDPAQMAAAREQLLAENGDIRTSVVIIDRLEATFGEGANGYVWDAQGWYGGDIHRFWWKSEGEGAIDGELETGEVEALYSRAFTPYFDFQAGVRQRYTPEADRTDLVVGVQGLAPYWFEVDVAAFLSNKGELSARAEAEYDLRLTQRLILQPRAEITLSAEDVPELAIGSGLTSAELGVRLRYEIRREFAPYVGIEWSSSFGDTRDYVEARGEDAEGARLVLGVRAWF